MDSAFLSALGVGVLMPWPGPSSAAATTVTTTTTTTTAPAETTSTSAEHVLDRTGPAKTFLFAPFLQWTVLVSNFLIKWDISAGGYVSTLPGIYLGNPLGEIEASVIGGGWDADDDGGNVDNDDNYDYDDDGDDGYGYDDRSDTDGDASEWLRQARRQRKEKKAEARLRRAHARETDKSTETARPRRRQETVEVGPPVLRLGMTPRWAGVVLSRRFESGRICQLFDDADNIADNIADDYDDYDESESEGEDFDEVADVIDDGFGDLTNRLYGWPRPRPRRQRVLVTTRDEIPAFGLDQHALSGLEIVFSS